MAYVMTKNVFLVLCTSVYTPFTEGRHFSAPSKWSTVVLALHVPC